MPNTCHLAICKKDKHDMDLWCPAGRSGTMKATARSIEVHGFRTIRPEEPAVG